MAEYKHLFDFEDITAFKKALEVYLVILEAQNGGAYELAHNAEFIKMCKAPPF